MISLPGFWKDPYYNKTQDELYGFGSNLLKGEMPEYYRPIGESGGPELENLISMGSRDTSKAIMEHAAKVGNRGGVTRLAPAIADVSTKLRYQDMERALKGRAGFLNLGTEMLGGVRGAGLYNQGQRNEYNLNKANFDMKQEMYQDEQDAGDDGFWSDILSSGIGAAATIFGGPLGGMLSAGVSSALKPKSSGGGTATVRPDMFSSNYLTKDYYNFKEV